MLDIFRVVVCYSVMEILDEIVSECICVFFFIVLFCFFDYKKFIFLLMYMLCSCISDSVYYIIQSDIYKDWNLSVVVSCLCLSLSLLKKKFKNENISYS